MGFGVEDLREALETARECKAEIIRLRERVTALESRSVVLSARFTIVIVILAAVSVLSLVALLDRA